MALEYNSTPIGNPKTDTFNIDKAADHGSNIVTNLNKATTNMFGVDVAYFRSIPHKNAEDVIYMNYTLYNVEDCPKSLKVMFQDAGYLAGDYTITLLEMDYNVPVQVQIDVMSWFEAYGPNTMPQRYDLLYIPLLHKIYEVDSTNQVFGFMEQLTHFNVVLKKYNPKEFRRESQSLAETIDSYTTSIEELFVDAIEKEVSDITNKEQFDAYNSTPLDNFKFVSLDRVSIESQLNKTYYNFKQVNNTTQFDIEYKTGASINFKYNSLLFTTKFRLNKGVDRTSVKVYDITPTKNKLDKTIEKIPIQLIEIDTDVSIIKNLNLEQGTQLLTELPINLKFLKIKDDRRIICYSRYVDFINFKDRLFEIKKLTIEPLCRQRLLSGVKDNKLNFNISVINNNIIEVELSKNKVQLTLDKKLKTTSWYALALKLNVENNIIEAYIYTINSFSNNSLTIRKFEFNSEEFKFDNIDIDRFGITGSNINITDIRLYNMPNEVMSNIKEKEIKLDITSKNAKNASYIIINDDCLIPSNKQNNPFVSKQR